MSLVVLCKFLFSTISFICAIPLNLFILIVIIRSWIKGGHQSPADLILSAIGLFNISMQSFQLILYNINYFLGHFLTSYRFYIFLGFFSGTILSGSWSTVWLCIFYCLKIVTFQHRLFINLRVRFPELLPRLLSGSILFSYGLMTILLIINIRYGPLIHSANKTEFGNGQLISFERDRVLQALDVGLCIHMLLILTSLSLTIFSLILHVLRLHRGSSSISFSHLKPHVTAVITMTLLLSLPILFFLAQLTLHLSNFLIGITGYWICQMIIILYCPLQALILIFGNKKLSLAFETCSCPYSPENRQVNE